MIVIVISGLYKILNGYFGFFRHEGFDKLLDGKGYKSIKNMGYENLLFESDRFIVVLVLFSKNFPVFLGLNEQRFVNFLLGLGHSLDVVFFHLLRFSLQILMSPGLSFECKWKWVNDFIANKFFDIAFDFVESELPRKRKEFDLLFELEVNVTFFGVLLELVFGLVVTFWEVAFEKVEHVLIAFNYESLGIDLLVLLDFVLAEFFDV